MTTPTENTTENKQQQNGVQVSTEWGDLSPDAAPKSRTFIEHPEERYRINPKRTLQSLIPPFSCLKMVMYVQRVDFIRDLFDEYGTDEAEVIIGDSIVDKNRSGTDPEVFLRLAELIGEGRLRIRIPKRGEFHEKWILAENKDGGFADIFGTANLTSRGSGRSGLQSNQVRVNRISGEYQESQRYIDLNRDYQKWYHDRSEPYLDDLVNLIQQEKEDETPRIEIVERWISYTGSSATAETTKVQALVHEFQDLAMVNSEDPDMIVTELNTEANDAVLDEVVKILAPAGIQRDGRKIFAQTRQFLNERVSTFPIMSIRDEMVTLRIDGNEAVAHRTAEEYDIDEISRGIESIHRYVETVERASSKNPGVAKKSVYEIILYFLSSPFHHNYMMQGKDILGWDYERGPKPLAIYGNTKNGKTYLLKYCSRLLTGRGNSVAALEDKQFSKTQIENLLTWGSLFPIIYDDISDTKWGKQYMDQIGRSYWDSWWNRGRNHSQLIVTSNKRVPQGQLKGRIKEVVMDARFRDTTDNIRHVTSIIDEDNPIFLYFSKRYLEVMQQNPEDYDHTDCMHIGRKVMSDLYSMADMDEPDFFPDRPLEDIVDGNALHWLSLLHNGDASWKITSQGELHLFVSSNDERGFEVKAHMDLIPEFLGPSRSGTKIMIPSPEEFSEWLKDSISSFEVRWPSRSIRKLLKYATK